MIPPDIKAKLQAKVQAEKQAALSREEAEKNRQRFLKDSAVQQPMYHGTSRDFSEFDRMASAKRRQVSMDTAGSWFSSNPDKAVQYAGGEGHNVMPVYLNIKNPKLYSRFDDFLRDMHEAEGRKLEEQNPRGVGSTEGLRKKLMAQGYDGIQFEQTDNARLYKDIETMQQAIKQARQDEFSVKRAERAPYTMKRERLENTLRSMADELKKMGGSTEFDGHDVYVAFHPHQIKSAIGNRGTYDPSDPDITKADGGLAHMSKGGLPGFYSPLESIAEKIPRTKGTPAEFMAEISKQPGFRAEEVADRGVALPQQKMTREQFLGHLKQHPNMRLSEVMSPPNQSIGVEDFKQWTLPGGKNYREMLLTINPAEKHEQALRDWQHRMLTKYGMYTTNQLTEEERDKENSLRHNVTANDYKTPHWEEPNVLAHIRFKDRTGPNGEKILHLEEIQSDWHQKGRKEGYRTGTERSDLAEIAKERERLKALQSKLYAESDKMPPGPEQLKLIQQGNDVFKQLTALIEKEIKVKSAQRGVPDAPFKKSWHELALKKILQEAVDKGYHGVAITPGQEQVDRYDLSRHLSEVSYSPEFERLAGVGKNGRPTVYRSSVKPEDLEGLVGKEIAKRLLDQPIVDGQHSLSGLDLRIGGERHRRFYDKEIPEYLNKLGKPHGAKVTNLNLVMPPKDAARVLGHIGGEQYEMGRINWDQLLDLNPDIAHHFTTDLHYFPITDSMRAHIKEKGLPMYEEGGSAHAKELSPWHQMLLQRAMGGVAHMADGGSLSSYLKQPTPDQMKLELTQKNPAAIKSIGADEAPDVMPKQFVSPGGKGMPFGGVDMAPQPGMQFMPQQAPQAPAQGITPPQPAPDQPGSNILQMTPQGRAMAAMTPQPMGQAGQQQPMMAMAGGGSTQSSRILIDAEGPGGVKGIMVPRHMLHGSKTVEGMEAVNQARAQVYGSENRPPLTLGQIGKMHKSVLEDHFAKPLDQQIADEKAALDRLRKARHIGKTANTLDESEKLDTVRHERDPEGRTYVGYAAKGTAGHSLYTSGAGPNQKYHVLNTCPGQTAGCGGGVDDRGIVDTAKGTCFAPVAETQYAGAAVRRASHTQAKHDPAMTADWILAHTGSMRDAANRADKTNQVLLFRPNVVDETDTSSRYVIKHLNRQRKAENKPGIVANSYGKTNELHDPANGYFVTYSNVGPKTKQGASIAENIARDNQRVRSTITATGAGGRDLVNDEGEMTPPKGSYLVTNVKRGSPLAQDMEKHITHAKYWSVGRPVNTLNDDELAEGAEGHYDAKGNPTTPDRAHFGHKVVNGKRFDYQKQHILHPRLVQVGKNADGSPHMIPTDSRFKDEEFLPKNRFMTKNGKVAGHILMTTPTTSTSNVGHHTPFTHHVGPENIAHAKKTRGEYVIDAPEMQEASAGKEYIAPQPIKLKLAEGGSVRTHGEYDQDMMAFPERSHMAQHHLAYRHDPEEAAEIGMLPFMVNAKPTPVRMPVTFMTNPDAMRLELLRAK